MGTAPLLRQCRFSRHQLLVYGSQPGKAFSGSMRVPVARERTEGSEAAD